MAKDDYIDPKGYFIDSDRNIRRLGDVEGEQAIILKATEKCTKAEWERLYQAMRIASR